MPEIRGQQGQAGLHVGALAIPSDEPVDRKGRAKIMDPWLPAISRRPPDFGPLTQLSKGSSERGVRERLTGPEHEDPRAICVEKREALTHGDGLPPLW